MEKIPLRPPFTKGDIIPPFGRACLPCTMLGSGPAGRQGRLGGI
jgi:hypothetical protein